MPITTSQGKMPSIGEVYIEKTYSGQPGYFRIFKMTEQGPDFYKEDKAHFYQPSTGKIYKSGTTTQFEDTGEKLDTTPPKYNTADVSSFAESAEFAQIQGVPYTGRQRYTEQQLTGEVPKIGEVGGVGVPRGTTPTQGGGQPTTHEVREGETLSQIGQRYGVDWRQITGFRSGDPDLIYPGEVLNIPSGAGGQVPGQIAPTGQPGDTGGVSGRGIVGGDGGVPISNIPEEIRNMLSPEELSFWEPMWAFLAQKQEQGKEIPPVLSPAELDSLWQEAKADPVISKYFSDQLRIGETNLTNMIADVAEESGQWSREQSEVFKQQRITGAEEAVAGGRAFSGYRQQARERLQREQTGIVSSTRRQLQRQLRQAGQAFETAFGTAQLPTMGLPFTDPLTKKTEQLQFQSYGDIAGGAATEQLSAEEQRYQDLIRESLQQKGAYY